MCAIYPCMTGNAVIHGNDEIRCLLRRYIHDFRCQPVTKFKTVGHQKRYPRKPHCLQTTDRQRGTGSTVGIEITNDQHMLTLVQ